MSEYRVEALIIMACELQVYIQIETECGIKYIASNSLVLT